MALHIGIGNFGGAIASNIYRTQDAPRYILGRMSFLYPSFPRLALLTGARADGIELMFVGIGFIAVPITVLAYKRINARREALVRDATEKGITRYTPEELRRMGDRAPDFRYTL